LQLSKPQLQIGNDYKISPSVSCKGKLDLPSNEVSLQLEHQLFNPKLSLGFAASFSPCDFAHSGVKANKFGVTLHFGDY